ncbi:MAG: ketopantoate reductase family protein [Bulleidia sp.]
MRYAIIGIGGTGGILGYYLTKAGKDCTLIARGENLKALQQNGLTVHHLWDDSRVTIPVHAISSEEYHETPDVILVCVKYYSIDSILPMVKSMAGEKTIVLPILNVFGTGEKMQEALPGIHVLDGCIYVSAEKEGPGTYLQHGPILRVVFGERDGLIGPELREIEKDMKEAEIEPVLTSHVQRDCLAKFSYVSPIGAAGLYYQAAAGDFQREGKERDTFIAMVKEIEKLASAMGYPFDKDYVSINLEILSHLDPSATTSMQRDVAAGHSSEIRGLVFDVARRGEELGIDLPAYRKIAEALSVLK